jgi:hypothetical protein
LLHPSADELNYTRRGRVKGVHVNTPIFTWAYTRTFKERGKKGSLTRLTPVVFPMQWDAVYLIKNRKSVTKNIYRITTTTTSQEKLKMRHWVNSNC